MIKNKYSTKILKMNGKLSCKTGPNCKSIKSPPLRREYFAINRTFRESYATRYFNNIRNIYSSLNQSSKMSIFFHLTTLKLRGTIISPKQAHIESFVKKFLEISFTTITLIVRRWIRKLFKDMKRRLRSMHQYLVIVLNRSIYGHKLREDSTLGTIIPSN